MKFFHLLLFISLVSFAQYYPSTGDSPEKELHSFLKGLQVNSVDFDKFNAILKKKPDLNYLNESGSNAFVNAIQSWSYNSSYNQEKYSKDIAQVVFTLIEKGSNINIVNYRGLSGPYYMFRWGNIKSKDFDPLLDKIMEKGFNPNSVKYEYKTFADLLISTKGIKTYFDKMIKAGMDLDLSPNILKFSLPNLENIKYLETLMSKKKFSKLVKRKDENKMTVLFHAVFENNIKAVKYLIENHQAQFNITDYSGRTPLNYAKEYNHQEILHYLKSKNAQKTVFSKEISCKKSNEHLKASYESIVQLISLCKIKTIKKLLKLLPKKYLAHHTFSYATLAAVDSSIEFPMVTTFGEDGKLMLSFNGASFQDGFNNLDIIQFRDKTKEFEFRQIKFPRKWHEKVEFSHKNPSKCLGCHGEKPRPLWDSWSFWPGKYFSEAGSLYPREKQKYELFLKNRNKGRYKHLPEQTKSPVVVSLGKSKSLSNFKNIKMDTVTEDLMTQMIVNTIIENIELNKVRYALMGALSCQEDIHNFIPEKVSKDYNLSHAYLKLDSSNKAKNELKNRLDLVKAFNDYPQGRYTLDLMNQAYIFPDTAGNNYNLTQTTNLRWILENNNQSMEFWFSPFNKGTPGSYSRAQWNILEVMLWDKLISKETDPELYKLYSSAISNYNVQVEFYAPLFYKSDTEEAKEVCRILKQKSLQEFK